jgi:excinuclease UvrABC nuclease subunit
VLPEALVISPSLLQGGHLDLHHPVGKLLISLRDYVHHFAVSYHRLKNKKSIFEN